MRIMASRKALQEDHMKSHVTLKQHRILPVFLHAFCAFMNVPKALCCPHVLSPKEVQQEVGMILE